MSVFMGHLPNELRDEMNVFDVMLYRIELLKEE